MKRYHFCLCIGRFQPFHWGHFELVTFALAQAEQVLILLGSHLNEPSLKNPWNANERETMIRGCFNPNEQSRLQFIPIRDHETDEGWATDIYQQVKAIAPSQARFAIVGMPVAKSFWTVHCPYWDYLEKTRHPNINATEIRAAYFQHISVIELQHQLPPSIGEYLRDFRSTPVYQQLRQEYHQ